MKQSALAASMATTIMALVASFAFAQSDPLGGNADTSDKSKIIVGSADFPESQILATIYGKALAAKGVKVEFRPNIGSREVYFPALKDGSIDLIPEYGGAVLRYLDKNSTQNSTDDVLAALKTALPEGVQILSASLAQDTNTVVVTQATAEKYGLKSIGDLKDHAGDWVLGGPPEWKVRPDGVPGFEKNYGVKFKSYKTLDVCGPLVLSALDNGQIQVGCGFSTDPALKSYKLVTLADPLNQFPSQNVLPLISSAKVTKEVSAVLDSVSAALTTEDLTQMNARITAHESYDAIAGDWLTAHNLN
ncbi:ABC transporter substrate-binding protein [Agrobacterium tumefaciens]|uniref:ABC transporter substrate-binding protein n=1 Tax=Agrobacterium tumefaciens TaxID=358 RepID=UPI001571D0BD|nr:ABC transporter substrate-binding protein [Agrobacterium tumefaciens]NTD87679.1 ABC transporter substrate-binding protein [Agrobacterium tumefaciens]NTD91554.1 ABC transporter substrate-binding protein [Agrobacterium tumefaciens]NTD95539.1 ABC transporter substrate-binding protein [Agrobacterium tumefaciens]NTE11649.1 ABC transporter substrate-binding protein [Agrobacterium tumefaciens]NTE25094.1 ABC transporter substrate-binding protein [Agrobacterium tumefaciens]